MKNFYPDFFGQEVYPDFFGQGQGTPSTRKPIAMATRPQAVGCGRSEALTAARKKKIAARPKNILPMNYGPRSGKKVMGPESLEK